MKEVYQLNNKLDKDHKSLYHIMENQNYESDISKLNERKAFLKRCSEANIVLPSNFKKGIDRDLLLIQQQRNIKVLQLSLIQNMMLLCDVITYKPWHHNNVCQGLVQFLLLLIRTLLHLKMDIAPKYICNNKILINCLIFLRVLQ